MLLSDFLFRQHSSSHAVPPRERAGPVKEEFRDTFVLGNLSRDEAHEFFFQHVLPTFSHAPDCRAAWDRVYEVCGSNPGLLRKCASSAAAFGSVRFHRADCNDPHHERPQPTWEGAVWTADDCRTVLQVIASSPHAAVPAAQLEAHLGFSLFGLRLFGAGGAVKVMLQSMNKMNLMLRRSYDPLARDIDAAAFGPLRKDVYTLPSAAHVCAARMELGLQ